MSKKKEFDGAPEWANFKATDADGAVFWFEDRPVQGVEYWAKRSGKSQRAILPPEVDWTTTLKERK
jgi:hypothetical protein